MSAVKLEPIKCGLCSFESKRITTIEQHILNVHLIDSKALYDKLHGVKLCKCGCGEETKWLNWKNGYSELKRGHNASIYDVYDNDTAKKIALTRGTNWIGKDNWAKGLTKDTDERISQRAEATSIGRKEAFKEGDIEIWSKGLTKDSDDRIAVMAYDKKLGFEDGIYAPWSKGLTKASDVRLKQMGVKISIAHQTANVRKILDTKKRLTTTEIKNRIELDNRFIVINDLSDYVNDATPNIYVMCTICKESTYSSLRKLQHHRCYNCDPSGSAIQGTLAAWIEKQLGFEVQKNTRNIIKGIHRGAELDIFLPQKMLAIEFNGLYWHSSIHKTSNYHQNKTQLCNDKNIKLLHVFEDEWKNKQHIIKSIIRHACGITIKKIGARSCKVVNVSPKQRKLFFDQNHIDGDTTAEHAIGLEYNNELQMVISFRKPFHKKYHNTLEIARVCTLVDTTVIGGLSKLTKCAVQYATDLKLTHLFTYVDSRFGSNGHNWETCGWKYIESTPPRWWWTDCENRFNRFKYKANKTLKLTEAQVAEEANVIKIFGCCNLKYEIKLNT